MTYMVETGDPTCKCTCRLAGCAGNVRLSINAVTRAVAGKHRQEWTGAELEIATRPGLTATQAALKLGRTMHAVKNIRKKCRADPKLKARLSVSLGEM